MGVLCCGFLKFGMLFGVVVGGGLLFGFSLLVVGDDVCCLVIGGDVVEFVVFGVFVLNVFV